MERSLSPTREETRSDMPVLSSLRAPVSPPRRNISTKCAEGRRKASIPENHQEPPTTPAPASSSSAAAKNPTPPPNLAAIEAGNLEVTDHLAVFASRLGECSRPSHPQLPRLPLAAWTDLYQRNQHPNGRHFVIHQHDHPVAGPHYDLRLQFSASSSVSWSVMYGLPGNANSRRLNRNATETRVHCLWVCIVVSGRCLRKLLMLGARIISLRRRPLSRGVC